MTTPAELRPVAAVPPASSPLDPEDILVFGYGSLMWSPGFEPAEVLPARVFGWHRRFSLVSTTSWGSPQRPGVCAALHQGGTCWGRALVLPRDRRASTLDYLDAREAAYLRQLVRVLVRRNGATEWISALTYVADPDHPRLAPRMSSEHAGRLARQGVGSKGTSYDYVRNAMCALEDDGHSRTDVHRFFAIIAA